MTTPQFERQQPHPITSAISLIFCLDVFGNLIELVNNASPLAKGGNGAGSAPCLSLANGRLLESSKAHYELVDRPEMAVSRRSGDEIHPCPPNGDLRPISAVRVRAAKPTFVAYSGLLNPR